MDRGIKEMIIRAGVVVGILGVYILVYLGLKIWPRKYVPYFHQLIKDKLFKPGLLAILLVGLNELFPLLRDYIQLAVYAAILHVLQIVLIIFTAYFLMRFADFMQEFLLHKYDAEAPDFDYRKAKTKYQLLQRIFNLLVTVVAVILVLMTFDQIRKLGTTLLASAGVVGIIIGFAAQKSLGTLFSGIVIAISEPIRLGDVVVVEGEYGKISEINLTFVVIQQWDGRNLIVPINYFLEETFQSWTRISPKVIGQVKLYVDYSVPLEELRNEFNRLVENSPLWDKRSKAFEATDATEKSVQLRGTMSAKDASDSWDLEIYVREQMILFIRTKYPHALPKTRFEGI